MTVLFVGDVIEFEGKLGEIISKIRLSTGGYTYLDSLGRYITEPISPQMAIKDAIGAELVIISTFSRTRIFGVTPKLIYNKLRRAFYHGDALIETQWTYDEVEYRDRSGEMAIDWSLVRAMGAAIINVRDLINAQRLFHAGWVGVVTKVPLTFNIPDRVDIGRVAMTNDPDTITLLKISVDPSCILEYRTS